MNLSSYFEHELRHRGRAGTEYSFLCQSNETYCICDKYKKYGNDLWTFLPVCRYCISVVFLYLNVTEDLQIIPRLKTLIVDYANYRPM